MFAINRRLTAMLLVIGFLVASWGMYEAFQASQADAHTPAGSCWLKTHVKRTPYTKSESVFMGHIGWIVTCQLCGSWALEQWDRMQFYTVKYQDTYHKITDASGTYWAFCHTHELSRTATGRFWNANQTFICSNPQCGG